MASKSLGFTEDVLVKMALHVFIIHLIIRSLDFPRIKRASPEEFMQSMCQLDTRLEGGFCRDVKDNPIGQVGIDQGQLLMGTLKGLMGILM